MTTKSFMHLGISLVCLCMPGCRKEVKLTTEKDTPLVYSLPKINGIHNWTGTYTDCLNHDTIDTNLTFPVKTITNAIIEVKRTSRIDTLNYFGTDEIGKKIIFIGRHSVAGDSYDYQLTYSYANDSLYYEEYLSYKPYKMSAVLTSTMVLKSY